jgi:hypothetical protein
LLQGRRVQSWQAETFDQVALPRRTEFLCRGDTQDDGPFNEWGEPVLRIAGNQAAITAIGLILLFSLTLVSSLALPPEAQNRQGVCLTFLIICLGGCIGNLMGALASPFQSAEKRTFKLVAGVASAFLTGFLWNTFQVEIKDIVHAKGQEETVQLFAFAIAVFLSGFVNYAFREYGRKSRVSFRAQLGKVHAALDRLEEIELSERKTPSNSSLAPQVTEVTSEAPERPGARRD